MNPLITDLERVPSPAQIQTILSKEGFTCALLVLAPGASTTSRDVEHGHEHILYVVDGQATIRFGEVNTILSKDQALLVPKGREPVIAAHPDGFAKLLRIDVPPRQLSIPPVITLNS